MISHSSLRFRWLYCQLESLRRCFPPSIRQTLEDLPATLDETYERALLGIDNEKREYAERLFQCLAVSVRPLRVEELAEAIVVNLGTEGELTVDAGWRPQDPEEAVLRTCSSLITITEIDGSRVVQFSHFSVKEWLVSSRLASRGDLSRYHIVPQAAHTTLARICLGILLQLDKRLDEHSIKNFPLAQYAAQHWVEHAVFEDVSTYIDREMECLFDPDKPHFSAWVWIYDLDPSRKTSMVTSHPTTPEASPLHYVALCGFLGLVNRLIASRPEDVHALDENGRTPLHAALYGGHTEVAQFLLSRGANRDAWDDDDWTPMHIASQSGNTDIVRLLLQKKAHLNTQTKGDRQTPLDLALHNGNLQVVRFLLEHGANVNTRDSQGLTPLHIAFQRGDVDASRLLLERGANVNARRADRQTPLHVASWGGELEFTRLFLDHRANVNARVDRNRTPLLMALGNKELEIVRLLLDHGADVNVKGEWDETPLHLTSENGDLDIMLLLLSHGADVDARDSRNRTPLHMALGSANPEKTVQTLLEHGADANAAGIKGRTPLHMASNSGRLEVVRLLLEHGANVNARSENSSTQLHVASSTGHLEIVQLPLENIADAEAGGTTPLHMAAMRGWLEVAQLLFEYGADVNAKDEDCWTPLHFAVEYNWDEPKVALWLIEHVEADVNSRDNDGCTPLHCASVKGNREVVLSLVKRGADVYARDNNDQTPFPLVQEGGYFAYEAEDCGGDFRGGMSTSEW
jgi:ankyrin repeat protein